ncbi:hypothetical protein [Pelagerythrobacter sp.]|uniref:hypothetical protein n=1 Tax=Pelagerythrobacter sp. TaxID=2800702 RepID=UPI0035AF3207
MHARSSFLLAAAALALASPALAQQQGSARDFQLPPDPQTTATPDVQGPVDPDAPVRTAPRSVPTPTPTAQPTPQPTAPAIPLQLPAQEPSTPERTPAQAEPAARPSPAPAEPAPTETAAPPPEAASDEPPATGGTAFDFTPSVTDSTPATAIAPSEEGGSLVPWLAALVVLLVAGGAGFWLLRRREELAPVPVVEPPLARREPRPEPQPESEPKPAAAPPAPPQSRTTFATRTESVSLAAKPLRFSRSMMNATFAWRLVLENRGGEQWDDLEIEADLVTAHGSAPIADQLADAAAPLAPMRTVAALAPGETVELDGDVRLPLQQVRAIRQGSAAVYVPLLRLRVAAKGKAPLARTFLVGQLPDRHGGNLRPFRLDEMPQSYSAIGMRPLD